MIVAYIVIIILSKRHALLIEFGTILLMRDLPGLFFWGDQCMSRASDFENMDFTEETKIHDINMTVKDQNHTKSAILNGPHTFDPRPYDVE